MPPPPPGIPPPPEGLGIPPPPPPLLPPDAQPARIAAATAMPIRCQGVRIKISRDNYWVPDAGVSVPEKKLRSWPDIRLHAVACTRAMNGNGTIAPTMAEVPVTFVPTLPADFACFKSQIVAS
jgi:hypothetical protein